MSHLFSMLCLRKQITTFLEPCETHKRDRPQFKIVTLLVVLARLPDSPLRHRLQHLTLFRATGYFRISFPVTQTPRGKCNCGCFVLGVRVLPMRLYREACRAAAKAACFCATVRRGDQGGESILLADLISCKTAHAASVEKSCRHREIIKLWHKQIFLFHRFTVEHMVFTNLNNNIKELIVAVACQET